MKKRFLLVGGLLVGVAVLALLCRTWTWDSPHPYRLSVKVADAWPDEQPMVNIGGVWSAPMPRLEARLNSEEFLASLKERLAQHPVTVSWDADNTRFSAANLGPGGPLVVQCEAPVYGVRRWSLLRHGRGVDRARTRQLKEDYRKAMKELLSKESS